MIHEYSREKSIKQIVKAQTDEFVSLLEKEGMTIVYPDLSEFKNATSDVIEVFADVYGPELTSTVKELTK